MPTVKNITTIRVARWVKANPSAVPRKGAVQGVARAVARTPLKNAPAVPGFDASEPAASRARPPGFTSNTPNRFKATRVTSTINTTTNCGLLNCMPQPARCPAAFTPITIPASTRKEASTPRA